MRGRSLAMLATLSDLGLLERMVPPPNRTLRELGFLRVELSALDRLGAPHIEDDALRAAAR